MTRQEFIEDVTTWSELIDFCGDECIDFCDNVYHEDSYDDCINEDLEDRAREDDWKDVLSWLYDLPQDYEYYIRDDEGEWSGADDYTFDRYKDDVLEYMDDGNYWEEEEEEDAPYEYHDPEDDTPVEEEDISVAELFTACSSTVQKLESDKIADAVAAEQAEAIAFDELCVSVGITVTVEGSN